MTPLVSICCTTYNHEKFIKQTLDGFLIQETTFPIEIIIHDDASTDNTVEIIKKYAQLDDRIVTILQEENQYSQKIKPWPNFLFPIAKGKYIALCEGDDYWTDPLKLQKQVDFLEKNDDYFMCFHEVQVLEDGELRTNTMTKEVPETTTISDIAKGNYIHTPSTVLRNSFDIPEWYNQTPLGDWTLYMLAIKTNKIKKLTDIMAVYRIHGSSVWSSKGRIKQLEGTIKSIDLLINSKLFGKSISQKLLKNKKRLQKNISTIENPANKNIWDQIKSTFKKRKKSK